MVQRRAFLGFWLIPVLLLAGLSGRAAEAATPRIFVLFGGFGSCALAGDPESMVMTDQFRQAVRNATAQDGISPRIYQACYAIGSGTLFYQRPNGTIVRGKRSDLVAELKRVAGPGMLNLVGQSHGGWTALVAAIELPSGLVNTVATIDPISIAECSSGAWLASSTGAVFGLGPSTGCSSFPRDLLRYERNIKANVKTWINFWQDQYDLLHSGPARGASENIRLSFSDPGWHPMGAHAATETSRVVWARLEALWSK